MVDIQAVFAEIAAGNATVRVDRGLWSKAGVPHHGWTCADVIDRGKGEFALCEMCESKHVRYAHLMIHEHYPTALEVGRVCAGRMEQNVERARRRERIARTRAHRRQNWLQRCWRLTGNGHRSLKASEFRVTVFTRGTGLAWCIAGAVVEYSTGTFATFEEAALAAFDRLEYLRKSAFSGDAMTTR